jgi:polysaccharide biosynthesis transport protein
MMVLNEALARERAMLQADMRLHTPDTQTIDGDQLSLGHAVDDVFGLLRRNLLIIFFTTLIGIVIGAAYLVYAPRFYSANAQVILDTRKLQVFQQQPVLADPPLDIASLESQMQILQSKAIALLVVRNLKLANDPMFIEQSRGIMSWLLGILPNPFSLTAPLTEADRSEEAVEAIQQSLAVEALQQNLKVTRVGASYVIDINFRSRSPERAVQIANAVADAFLADQMESKYQSMQRTTAWLQDRLGEVRDQQRNADRSVAAFKAKNNIVAANSQPIKQNELNLLNSQLVTARNRTSELQAKLDRIEAIIRSSSSATTPGAPDPTVSDTLTNTVITKLRDKYLDYAAREADYSAKYGSNHYAVVNLRRQMSELRGSILDELRRIAESYKSDIEIAKRHQDDLEKEFASSEAQSGGPLQELQGSADSYRALYEGFLQRYMQSVQEQSSPNAEARLLSRASLPALTSGPQPVLIAAFASIGGLMFGVGIGTIRQMSDRVFRTPDQVEAALHTECISIVPHVKRRKRPGFAFVPDQASAFSRQGIMWDTIDAPFARYAEAIRAVKFAVDSNGDATLSKVIGVTSSLPNEGKSTIAGSLALLAADAGAKAILVDCDLRNPQLSSKLTPNAKFGLLNVIAGDKSIEQVVVTDASTGLTFLPIGSSSEGRAYRKNRANSNHILNCDAVQKLFEKFREKYEYIVVDLPPIAPIVDVRSTARFIDSYVLALEWGCTKAHLVQHALKQASGVYAKLIGVVLNKTPLASLGRYQGYLDDYYNSKRFKQYGEASVTKFIDTAIARVSKGA